MEPKPYSKEGESDSMVMLGWVMLYSIFAIPVYVFFFLWGFGVIKF